MRTIKGIDVSYYDSILNWKDYSWDFAFIKCSEGLIIDTVFQAQWKASHGKVIRGAYHFFRPSVDARQAARNAVEYMGGDLGELPLALDLEVLDNQTVSNTVTKIITFIDTYKLLTGEYPIIYSSPNFLDILKLQNYSYFNKPLHLWLAAYPYDRILSSWSEAQRKATLHEIITDQRFITFPKPIAPFKRISFYQFTGKGDPNDVPGYFNLNNKEAADFNLYNGSYEDLLTEFQITFTKQEGENMPTIYGKMKAFANIRSSMPGGTYQDIGDLPVDTYIEADYKAVSPVDNATWYHLTKATLNNQDVLTTSGKKVSEVPAFCYGVNVVEYSPTTPAPNKTITNIQIINPDSVVITWSDNSTQTL